MKNKHFLSRLFLYFSPVRIFLINLSWVLAVVIAAIYIGIYYRNNILLMQSLKNQASSYYDLIVTTREWNADYQGVYVEKKTGTETNPYLRELGVEPEIAAVDGRVLTMRNPAMMTREISRITERGEGTKFHLTSKKLVNPGNKPDRFEEDSLTQFEQGVSETWEIQRTDGSSFFRFMKPLTVQEPCLKCHKSMGYKVGDIRGGISISIPFSETDRQMKINRLIIICLSVLTLAIILSAIYVMASHMVKELDIAQEQLREASITDALTGMKNRRYVMDKLKEEFERARRLASHFGVIIMDIDHFKKVNDTYGHLFGDFVLKAVAKRIMSSMRIYDDAGRYGGEEFLIITPGIASAELSKLAWRICEVISKDKIEDGVHSTNVTVSIGATLVAPEDKNFEAVISRADNALYKSKMEGRNRVTMA